MPQAELIWTAISFILTILVLTYLLLGDNPFFRVATYAFIGVAGAYVVLTTFNQVIWPKVILPLLQPSTSILDKALLGVPLLLSLLLFTKLSPRLAFLGNPSMAFLVGSGAAVMIGGVVLGTLFPQSQATMNLFDLRAGVAQGYNPGLILLDAVVVLIGTASTLIYFSFGAKCLPNQLPTRGTLVEFFSQIGKAFIAITFGAIFAGVYAAALTALIERVSFLWNFIF